MEQKNGRKKKTDPKSAEHAKTKDNYIINANYNTNKRVGMIGPRLSQNHDITLGASKRLGWYDFE